MALVRIKENPRLIRDTHSKAVLNTDKEALKGYYAQVEIAKKEKTEKLETQMRLQKLEQNMEEIRSLLLDIAKMRKE